MTPSIVDSHICLPLADNSAPAADGRSNPGAAFGTFPDLAHFNAGGLGQRRRRGESDMTMADLFALKRVQNDLGVARTVIERLKDLRLIEWKGDGFALTDKGQTALANRPGH